MPDEFPYDVFLSHSAKDKAVVRPLAERLRADGVKVWFDESEIPKDEGKRQKDEIELLPSYFLLHPFPCTPLNKERRFLPLRLDDATLKEHFHHRLFNRFDFDPTIRRIGCMDRLPRGVGNPVITHCDSLAQEAKA